jgi:hypothetical protein
MGMALYSLLLAVGLVVCSPWWLARMVRYRAGMGQRLGRVPAQRMQPCRLLNPDTTSSSKRGLLSRFAWIATSEFPRDRVQSRLTVEVTREWSVLREPRKIQAGRRSSKEGLRGRILPRERILPEGP